MRRGVASKLSLLAKIVWAPAAWLYFRTHGLWWEFGVPVFVFSGIWLTSEWLLLVVREARSGWPLFQRQS